MEVKPRDDWPAFVRAFRAAIRLGGYGEGKAAQLKRWPRGTLSFTDRDLIDGLTSVRYSVVLGGAHHGISKHEHQMLMAVVNGLQR